MGRTGAVFEAAQRAREAHQKALNEMVEETLRIIAKTRGHSQSKCRHVQDSTKSFKARFDHEINTLKNDYRKELNERCTKLEASIPGIEDRVIELEAELENQREVRKRLIEEQLGPIRDEEKRLIKELDLERRARKLEEERREKMLQDEVEAITKLIDKEKFERELKLHDVERVAVKEQQHMEKRCLQAEVERKAGVKALKEEIEEETGERIEKQHGVIESIAAFVKRYRGQVWKELEVNNMTVKNPHAD